MRTTIIVSALLAATAITTPAFAQTKSPDPAASSSATTAANSSATVNVSSAQNWRASKLVGVNVYNEKNEKIGDINEIILDHSGKVAGVVIGVGGFLGMGEHDVLIPFSEVKFVNEPMRTATTATTTTSPRPATTGAAPDTSARPATTTSVTTSAGNSSKNWYPDHAVITASKEQLKGMTQFKYN